MHNSFNQTPLTIWFRGGQARQFDAIAGKPASKPLLLFMFNYVWASNN